MDKKNTQGKCGIRKHGVSEMCQRYGPDVYMRYLDGSMGQDDLIFFERHCTTCRLCRSAVKQTHQRLLANIDAEHEQRFLEMALQKIEEKFCAREPGIIDIIVRFLEAGLEIVATTAEALLPAPVAAVRGSSLASSGQRPVRLIQTTADPPLSVQLQLSTNDARDIELEVTIFDKQQDVFITRFYADIEGPAGTCVRRESSSDGMLACRLAGPGAYGVRFQREGGQLCEIRVKAG